MKWITDWSEIVDSTDYIVCGINSNGKAGDDLRTWLSQPISRSKGWYVKTLMERCYAALPVPAFEGLPEKEKR